MATVGHSFDSSCLLHTDSNVFTRRASQVSLGPPPLRAQYFYCSSLPIDDPLFPVPPPNSSSLKSAKFPPRPFSIHDNRALEEAWLRIHKPFRSIESVKRPQDDSTSADALDNDASSSIHSNFSRLFKGSQEKKGSRKSSVHTEPYVNGHQTRFETSESNVADRDPQIDVDSPQNMSFSEISPVTAEEIREDESRAGLTIPKKRSKSPFRHKDRHGAAEVKESADGADDSLRVRKGSETLSGRVVSTEVGIGPTERSTTGTPFIRIPSGLSRSRSPSRSLSRSVEAGTPFDYDPNKSQGGNDNPIHIPSRATLQRLPRSEHLRHDSQAQDYETSKKIQETRVPVGVSRLHVVEMPTLKVRPTDSCESYILIRWI